ncbi:PREDICTED: metalloendoproteinase 2-MMP-like [Ipomoea nil]|uniref:metalloendoproteinase 2-MMP-like n=1 Tax=Ipomoea nil TaxID=35883 RepID=UPI0009013D33|nr:PREDICTED: metalloendoproteinase 2-MMP-like [Ipomoea nil]
MAPKVSLLLLYAFLFLSLFFSQISSSPSAFDFINQLQGSKKGDRVKGLYNLKKYLKTFGYINDLSYNSSSSEADYFSDQLESAIRIYQTRHHLNSTGILDADTARQMMKPRCGVADIINGTRRRPGGEVVPHYRFYPDEPKWPANKRHLTYGFAPGTPSKFIVPVATALKAWHNVGEYFSFSRTGFFNADLKFALFSGEHGDGVPFDGRGGSYAHAFPPEYGDCHFDADEHWVEFGPPPNGLDIQSVALHEIGHLLGLDHSEHREAVMWEEFEYGEKKRDLTADDINGIRALYHF